MKPYALIDLHCDTLTDCKYSSGLGTDTLDDPQRVLSLSSIPEGVHWAQFYAIFIPDECRGEDAIRYYEANRDNFIRQMDKFSDRVKRCRTCADMEEAFQSNRTAAFLSVENGSALAGVRSRPRRLSPAVHTGNPQLRADDGSAYVEITPGGAVTAVGPSSVTVRSGGSITLDAPRIVIKGLLSMQSQGGGATTATLAGSLNATGDVTASNISLNSHTHPGDSGGTTGGPQ